MPSSYALGSHFEMFIQRQLASGRYSSASEVVRQGLRLLEEREQLREIELAKLRSLIQEGIDSGPAIDAELVFDELEKEFAAGRF